MYEIKYIFQGFVVYELNSFLVKISIDVFHNAGVCKRQVLYLDWGKMDTIGVLLQNCIPIKLFLLIWAYLLNKWRYPYFIPGWTVYFWEKSIFGVLSLAFKLLFLFIGPFVLVMKLKIAALVLIFLAFSLLFCLKTAKRAYVLGF